MTGDGVLHTGKRGTAYGWYVLGCRCPECEVAAHTKKRKLRPAGMPQGGQRKPLPEHGTRQRYSRGGCHCEPCTEANRLAHYFYTDGRPKVRADRVGPARAPQPVAPKQATALVVERAAVAKPLRIVGEPSKAPPRPVTYVPEPVDLCGLDLPHGGFCTRRVPCARPEHQEVA